MANETSTNAGVAGAASGGIPVLGLLVVSAVLGTLIGLLVLASMQHGQEGPTVGVTPEAGGHTELSASDSTPQDSTGTPTTDSAGHVHNGPNVAGGADHALQPRASTVQAGVRAPGVKPQVDNSNVGQPNVGRQPIQKAPPAQPGADAPVAMIDAVLLGGDRPLHGGEEFQLQISLADLGGKLLDYAADLQFNSHQITIDSIEGVKGGFAAPTSIVRDAPGRASWRAVDTQSTFYHTAPVALIRGKIAEGVTGTVRLYLNPTALQVELAGAGARRIAGMARAIPLRVE